MRLRTLSFAVLFLAMPLLTPQVRADTLTVVTSPSGLGSFAATNITTALGPPGTLVTPPAVLPVAGIPGLTVAISNASGNPFQRYDQGSSSDPFTWGGNFAPGTELLWTNSFDAEGNFIDNGQVEFTLSSPEHGIGFYISSDTYGTFSADLCAYAAASALLGCNTFTGTSAFTNDGTAPFIGYLDSAANISSVTVTESIVTVMPGMFDTGPNDFAFSSPLVATSSAIVTPEPGTLVSLTLGLVALAAFALRKKLFPLAG